MDSDENSRLEAAFQALEAGEYETALRLYSGLAENGSTRAQLALGWMFHVGKGISSDLDQAQKWYWRAADAGSAEAFYYLGVLKSKQREYGNAVAYFERAASENYMPAVYALGLVYDFGAGVAADKTKALQYYRRAAQMGHLFAQRVVGGAMMRGRLGLVQIPRGIALFTRAVIRAFLLAFRDPYSERLRVPGD